MKLKPFVHMPPMWVGGQALVKPAIYSHIQVDGSFKSRRDAAIAVKYRSACLTKSAQFTKPVYAVENSTEAEWIAIYAGITFGLENNEKAMIVENDCQGIIHHLMQRDTVLRRDYARHWRAEIYKLAEKTEWTGVRWIPRAYNTADELF